MSFLNQLIGHSARISGVPYILRNTIQKKKVTILMFHQPSVLYFEKAIEALKKRYNIISLSRFQEASANPKTPLPPKALVITLDDGWQSNFSLLPVIEKQQIPVTVFLMAGITNTSRKPWFSFITDKPQKQELKTGSDSARMAHLKHKGFTETHEYEERTTLNIEEIQIMQATGLVEFGSHTLFHPILPTCNDAKAAREIQQSKVDVETLTGKPCSFFSFPNGEYSERDIRICKKAGYKAAVTLDTGFNSRRTDPFKLKRVSVPDNGTVSELLVKASGTWTFFKVLAGKQKRSRRHSGW